MFLNLLRQRFGDLSTGVTDRVHAASMDDLTAWSDTFFRANTAEELVGLSL